MARASGLRAAGLWGSDDIRSLTIESPRDHGWDDAGIFHLDELPTRPMSLTCRALDDPPSWVARTEWVMP